MRNKIQAMNKGIKRFIGRMNKAERLYATLALKAASDKSSDKVYRIREPRLFRLAMKYFGAILDQRKAKVNLDMIYEAGIHKETGALIVSNKGATLYSLSPRARIPHITRHIGFTVYMPGLGTEFVNVGIIGNIYDGRIVLRSESACTPSFLYGSQRCNCAYQWESIRELAACYNKVMPPAYRDGARFESWVQRQFSYDDHKHLARNKGVGFILMHVDTQNGMGSGYTKGEYAFDLFSRASMRHRGEYSSEQIAKTSMWGGFEALGLTPDPRKEQDNAGYKITFTILDYLGASKDIIFLTNNRLKMIQLKNNGYKLTRVKSIGAVNPAGALEAKERGADFGHQDINGELITFEEELGRLKKEITSLLKGGQNDKIPDL